MIWRIESTAPGPLWFAAVRLREDMPLIGGFGAQQISVQQPPSRQKSWKPGNHEGSLIHNILKRIFYLYGNPVSMILRVPHKFLLSTTRRNLISSATRQECFMQIHWGCDVHLQDVALQGIGIDFTFSQSLRSVRDSHIKKSNTHITYPIPL